MQQELNVINRDSLWLIRDLDPKVKQEMGALEQAYDDKIMSPADRIEHDKEHLPKFTAALQNVSDETLLMYMSGLGSIPSSITDSKLFEKEIMRRVKEAANGNQEVMKGKHFETLLFISTKGRKQSNEFDDRQWSIKEGNDYIAEHRGNIKPEDIKKHEFQQNVELNDFQSKALENYRNFQQENTNSGENRMADAEKLGEYHDLFFKLGGTKESESEFMALTDPQKIEHVKNVYEAWVSKYVNIGENTPEDKKQEAAEKSYFDKREEEIEKMDKKHPNYAEDYTKATKKLAEDYEKAGWKSQSFLIRGPNGQKFATPDIYYNPESSDYKGLTINDIRSKLVKEYLAKHPLEPENSNEAEPQTPNEEEPKENGAEPQTPNEEEPKETEAEPLNVTEHDDEQAPVDENQDWKDEKEKFWKEHCTGQQQECTRDPEDKEGLSLDISKGEKKLGHVRYANKNNVAVSGDSDYSVFLGVVKDAKRNNMAINFNKEMSPEFAAKLKLACEEMGVPYQNAPEGKIDANTFSDQLSEEAKKKLEEYNAAQEQAPRQDEHAGENTETPKQDENASEPDKEKSYDDYLKKYEKDLADGKEIDISALDGKAKAVAYAAAVVAAKNAQKDDIEIKGKPEKTIGYKNEKVFDTDENGQIKKGDDGKPLMKDNPLYEATKDLPEEARTALEGHNQGVRQKQVEAARARMTPEQQTAHDDKETKREEKRNQPNMSREEIFKRFQAQDNSGR